jgi:molybdate transport system regulatory protein
MLVPKDKNDLVSINQFDVYHLTEDELDRLTYEFQQWFEKTRGVVRSRYWLVFLFLRYTGARITEVLSIDETRDIDFKNSTVRLITLKRINKAKQHRVIPIPDRLISEYLRVVKLFPSIEQKAFKLKKNNFLIVFKKLCKKANIPAKIAHPHVLRHTRAIELIRNGIPVTAVQTILGHSSLNTTAMYLKYSNTEIQAIMKAKGLL